MERIRDYVHVAGANLRTNPLRSLLSILGIVVGTASVISVLALGAGARKDLLDSVSKLGTEVFRVTPEYNAAKRRIGKLTMDDLLALRRLPSVLHAFADARDESVARTRFGVAQARLLGVDGSYVAMNRLRMIEGRDFNPIDHEERRLVCLLNEETGGKLFPNRMDALGADVYVLGTKWTVIGTFLPEGATGKTDPNRPADFLVPLASLARNSTDMSIREIIVHVDPDNAAGAGEMIGEIVHRNDPVMKTLYSVEADRERIARRLENRRLLFVLWTAIASISLIVGGIGMMNVMLTSVAERTREIGLRRAIGARRKDILIQFLVESCILSVIGGVLGLFAGAAAARALPLVLSDFGIRMAVMQPSFALGAVAAGMVLGIVFGLYPAIKAAAFSPAEALRYD